MNIPKPAKSTAPRLYRYQSPSHLEWLKVIILGHELYLPSVSQLDDPSDGRPRLGLLSPDDLVRALLDHWIKRNPNWTPEVKKREELRIREQVQAREPEALRRKWAEVLNQHFEEFRVYSLSKRFDNMSLWAKYAADHTGYCLEFANEGLLFVHAKDVTYGPAVALGLTDPEFKNGDFLFYKDQEWSNQEEVRLVLPRDKGTKVKIEPHWLTRVILGTHMSDAHRKLIREWAKERRPELTVVNATYDPVDHILSLNA
jgi:hypothetical protein